MTESKKSTTKASTTATKTASASKSVSKKPVTKTASASKSAKKITEKVSAKASSVTKTTKSAAKTTAAKTAKPKSTKPKSAAKLVSSKEKSSTGLKLHHLHPADGAHKSKTRVGRGDASKGKTSGRGTKGTHARNTVYKGFEGGQMPLHMRFPKLRGFTNPFRKEYQVVNLDRIEKIFPKGGKISELDLVKNGLVRDNSLIKVLGNGEITVKIEISAHKFSTSAVKKIEAAGGKCNVIEQLSKQNESKKETRK